MCAVTTKNKIQEKLIDKGTAGIFVGYPQNHADDVYWNFNPVSMPIIKSRNTIWFNMKCGNRKKFKERKSREF
jgi:hypothetical protein